MTQLRLIGFFIVAGIAIASWVLTCAAWRADRVIAGVAPLDPRRFEGLTVVTVGTGGAYENPNRLGPAVAVGAGEALALVDAGRGVSAALRSAAIPVSQITRVHLSSLLPENTTGLSDLWLTGWLDGREAPLRVVGPPGTRSLTEGLLAAHAAGVAGRAEELALPEAGARFETIEVTGDWAEAEGELSVEAGALPGGPLPALGWRFAAGGRSVVVAPTGWAPDALVEFARGADALVHEAVLIPEPELAREIGLDVDPERLAREGRLHTSIEAVGGLATRADVGTLVLVRLRPPPVYAFQISRVVDDAFRGRIVIPADGDEIRP